MAHVILHIGAHKTATSFLQRQLFFHRTQLEKHQIYYPDLGPNPAHHILATPWISLPEIDPADLGAGGPDGLWRDLVTTYAHRPGTLFLSAEVFSRAAPEAVNFTDLRSRLAAFDSVQVLYVMRRQPELLQSIWLQVLKSGTPPPFDRFLAHALRHDLASGLWLDHTRVYEALLQGFDPTQITLWDYDQLRQAPGGVLQAVLDLLQLPLRADGFPALPPQQANPSPDPLASYAAYRLSAPHHPGASLMQRAHQALIHLPKGRHTLFTRSQYQAVLDRFVPLNTQLITRHAPYQPDVALTMSRHPPDDLLWRDQIGNMFWLDLLNQMQKAG
jgi:hypothetical protein